MTQKEYSGRKLLLMRHGKSDWSVDADDFDRPLKKRGIKAARQIGYWLSNNTHYKPDVVLSSPAERALSTASIIADMLPGVELELDDRIYEADIQQLLQVLSEIPGDINCPLLVGHNPGLESLLLYLSDVPKEYYSDWKLLTTGTLVVIKVPCAWDDIVEKSGQFKNLLRGRDL
jgi:phosphohistidine phosphatase